MPNLRRVKVWRSGTGLCIVIPKDWTRGMDIEAGDRLEMLYNGDIRLRKLEDGESVP